MYKGFLGPFGGFAEKLLNIKTARFYGKVFIGCPPVGREPKKLRKAKYLYFGGKVFVEQDLSVLFKKLKSFFKKKGKHIF